MSYNVELLERRLQFSTALNESVTLTGIPFEPKMRANGLLAITGGDAAEGVRVALVKSATQLDTEPWPTLIVPVEKGTGSLVPGTEASDATSKVVAGKGGPYVRVSTPGHNWFFRDVNVSRISIGMGGGSDLIAIQRDLRRRVYADAGDGNDFIYGGRIRSYLAGAAGNDTIFAGQSADTLDGGAGDDALVGDAGENLLLGGDGNDTLKGGFGTDTLFGGDGDDELNGGFGGADYLYGNAGNDVFLLKDQPHNRDVARGGGGKDRVLTKDGDDIFIQ